jgi:AAA15 family ATPase/GTPase
MKLKTVRIRHFKHVVDSSLVEIQPDVTCLIGKNESGKTAFLEALRRLKPAQGLAKFSSATHYPAWLEKRHRREARAEGRDLDDDKPITVTFILEKADREAVEACFGDGVLTSEELEISRKYNNSYAASYTADESKAVANLLSKFQLDRQLEPLNECKTFGELRTEVANLRPEGSEEVNTQVILPNIAKAMETALPKFGTYCSPEYQNSYTSLSIAAYPALSKFVNYLRQRKRISAMRS